MLIRDIHSWKTQNFKNILHWCEVILKWFDQAEDLSVVFCENLNFSYNFQPVLCKVSRHLRPLWDILNYLKMRILRKYYILHFGWIEFLFLDKRIYVNLVYRQGSNSHLAACQAVAFPINYSEAEFFSAIFPACKWTFDELFVIELISWRDFISS